MRGFTFTVLAVVTSAGLSTASLAGIHDVARRFNDIGARSDVGGQGKDTVTVTVTSFPTTCSATTVQPATSPEASESASTPVVVVPGTQSMTATYNVPVGGATITPGASAMSSMQSAAVPMPASSNATSGALGPVPMASYSILPLTPMVNPTSAAPQSSPTTETKSATTTEMTTSQASTTSPNSSSTNAPMGSNDATKSFNGMTFVIMGALAGGVALLL